MKESDIMVLDEKDLRYVKDLVSAGFTHGEARVLVALSQLGESDYETLIRATGMKNSVVSVSCSKLRAYGIIVVEKSGASPDAGPGRRVSMVRIAGDLVDLVSRHLKQRARVEQLQLATAARQYKSLNGGVVV